MAKSLLSLFKPGQTELDFSDPKQAQAYIDLFGGEDYVKSKYPLFYGAWKKTQKYASEQLIGEDSGIQGYGCSLGTIHTVQTTKTNQDESSAEPKLESTASFVGVPPVSVFMHGEMIDETEHALIDTFNTLFTMQDYDENDFLTKTLSGNIRNIYAERTKSICALLAASYSDKNGLLKAINCETHSTLLGGEEVFQEITIMDPKSSKNNNPIQYVYGRPADAGTDYSVTDSEAHVERNPDGTGKKTGIYLKMKGEFTTTDKVTPIEYSSESGTYTTQLQFANEGIVKYDHDSSEIAKFFKVTGNKVEFDYAPFWGDSQKIDCSKFGTKVTLYLRLQGYFTMDFGSPIGKWDTSFGVQSVDSLPDGQQYYTITNSSIVYIPPLRILWGCFSKDCTIRMADGTEKAITELAAGDMVSCGDGSTAQVISASVGGHEDKMIHIETVDGHSIEVSDYHPIKTMEKTIPALELKANDVVVLENGTSPVLYAYPVDYDDEVCSVVVSGGYLVANGFLTGDAEIQKNVQHKEAETLSEEALALSKEMELAFSELLK